MSIDTSKKITKITYNGVEIPLDGMTPTGTIEITENGTHDVTEYASANINVPIPDGYIQPSGSINITDNGTINVTNYASANVNVPKQKEEQTKSVTITENGTTTVSPDSGKVLSGVSVTVNVESSGGGDELEALVNRTITSYSSDTTAIPAYVFHGCSQLVSVDLPNATTLKTSAFNACTKLASINIPLVKDITTQTFYSCNSLTTLTMPSLKTTGAQSVRNCARLARVDMSVITSIGALCFNICPLLETVIIRTPSVCALGNVSAFTGTPIESGTGYIYVPDNLVDSYKAATNWNTYAAQIKGLSELED